MLFKTTLEDFPEAISEVLRLVGWKFLGRIRFEVLSLEGGE